MPVRKADASLWNNIAGSLDGADMPPSNDYSNLPKHKAPERIWQGIVEHGTLRSSYRFRKLFQWAGIGGCLLSVILVGLLFLEPRGTAMHKDIQQEQDESALWLGNRLLRSSESGPKADIAVKPNEIWNNSQPLPINQKAVVDSITGINGRFHMNNETIDGKQYVSLALQKEKTLGHSEKKIIQLPPVNKSSNLNKEDFTNCIDQSRHLLPGKETISRVADGDQAKAWFMKPIYKVNAGVASKFPMELVACPEYAEAYSYYDFTKRMRKPQETRLQMGLNMGFINYLKLKIEDMDIPQTASTFGLDVIFSKKQWQFKTGMGYLAWKENAKFRFDYEQNEIVYTYQYVDSASFDPQTGEIQYHTTKTDVYDYVNYQKNDVIVSRYRLLQIPLQLGCRLISREKLSAWLLAGVGLDIQLDRKEQRPVLISEQGNVLNTESWLVDRYGINWRLNTGVQFRYALSKKMYIQVEPLINYYPGELYRRNSSLKVAYFEFRTGLIYNF